MTRFVNAAANDSLAPILRNPLTLAQDAPEECLNMKRENDAVETYNDLTRIISIIYNSPRAAATNLWDGFLRTDPQNILNSICNNFSTIVKKYFASKLQGCVKTYVIVEGYITEGLVIVPYLSDQHLVLNIDVEGAVELVRGCLTCFALVQPKISFHSSLDKSSSRDYLFELNCKIQTVQQHPRRDIVKFHSYNLFNPQEFGSSVLQQQYLQRNATIDESLNNVQNNIGDIWTNKAYRIHLFLLTLTYSILNTGFDLLYVDFSSTNSRELHVPKLFVKYSGADTRINNRPNIGISVKI